MRHAVLAGACALLVGASSAASAQAAQKFAYINSQNVLAAAPGAADAQALFAKEMDGLRAQVQKLGDSLTAMTEAYRKEELTLSPAAKETRLKGLREKEQEFQERQQKLQEQADQRQQELMTPILDNVRKVLDEVRSEGGYSFIFDVAQQPAIIVSADKNLDVTDRVVSRLKLSAPKAAAAKPAAGPTTGPAALKKPPTR